MDLATNFDGGFTAFNRSTKTDVGKFVVTFDNANTGTTDDFRPLKYLPHVVGIKHCYDASLPAVHW